MDNEVCRKAELKQEVDVKSIYPAPINLQDHGEHPDMCPTAIIDVSVGCTEKEFADYHIYIRFQERALQRHFGVGNMFVETRLNAAMERGELPPWEDLLPRASMPPRAKLPFKFDIIEDK